MEILILYNVKWKYLIEIPTIGLNNDWLKNLFSQLKIRNILYRAQVYAVKYLKAPKIITKLVNKEPLKLFLIDKTNNS